MTGVLSDFEITKIIKKYSGQELVENLVTETKAKGAPDNVTVIWAEIVLEEDASLYFDMGRITESPVMAISFPVNEEYINIIPSEIISSLSSDFGV